MDATPTPTPTPAALALAFARLPSPDSRRNALLALLPILSAHEWRWLHSTTAARPFHCDLIARLPLELAAHVFSYLDPAAPFRLTSVSRRWNYVLRSLPLLTHSLHAWYGSSLNLDAPDYDACRRKAQLVHAFRRAIPTRCFAITDLPSGVAPLPLLIKDTLIWRTRDLRRLYLLNLSTWSLRTLNGQARELISAVCASPHIVAFTTKSNVCYVAPLDGHAPPKKFRVANPALFSALNCRQRTVGCAGILNDHITVYIWDFDTQQGTSFNIDLHSHLFLHTSLEPGLTNLALWLLLQPDTRTVVVFVMAAASSCSPEVHHSRYTYNGECLSTSTTHIHDLICEKITGINVEQLIPAGHNQVFSLSFLARKSRLDVYTAAYKLQFDEQLNQFTNPYCPTPEKGTLWAPGVFGWWNDTFYKYLSTITDDNNFPIPILSHMGTSDSPTCTHLLRDTLPHGSLGSPILINDRFIARSYSCDASGGFYIMCFHDQSAAPQQDGPFFDIGSLRLLDALPR